MANGASSTARVIIGGENDCWTAIRYQLGSDVNGDGTISRAGHPNGNGTPLVEGITFSGAHSVTLPNGQVRHFSSLAASTNSSPCKEVAYGDDGVVDRAIALKGSGWSA